MNDLKIGDVVRLKHGGPRMTVSLVNVNGYWKSVEAMWFDNNLHLHSRQFDGDALEVAAEVPATNATSPNDGGSLPF